jgi:hypothetical protein
MVHPFIEILESAAEGRYPPVDGLVELLPRFSDSPHECVVEFTGHAYVLSDVSQQDFDRLGADGFGGVVQPEVLRSLAGRNGWIGSHDVLLCQRGLGRANALALRTDLDDHYRVQHARVLRREVKVFGDERGLVTLGRGVADRTEISIEVAQTDRSKGFARSLLADAIGLVDEGAWCFAEVSPGNAASLRAFLAADWKPIGAEVVYTPKRCLDVGHSAPPPMAE